MATNTFDRELEIQDLKSLEKLIAVMHSSIPEESLPRHSLCRKRSFFLNFIL